MSKIAILHAKDGFALHELGRPFEVDIKSAASALSHINRFTGHVGRYSVATHSVLVSRLCPAGLELSGLLHDACEAFLGDVAAPLKAMIGPRYAELEDIYLDHVDKTFGTQTRHPAVKQADTEALQVEAEYFGLPIHVADVLIELGDMGGDLAYALATTDANYDYGLFIRELGLLTGAKV